MPKVLTWAERMKKFEEKQRETEVKRASVVKKSPKQQKQEKAAYQKENTKVYSLRITNSSGIPTALEKMTADTGLSATEYLREALLEKLDFDGYIRMEVVKQKRQHRKFDDSIEE